LGLNNSEQLMHFLFNEELGLVIEVSNYNIDKIFELFGINGIPVYHIGLVTYNRTVRICNNYFDTGVGSGIEILNQPLGNIRSLWEDTSYRLEKLQCNLECVEAENQYLINNNISGPKYLLSEIFFNFLESIYNNPKENIFKNERKFKIAIIREEGSNGDREMAASFYEAGFCVVDVTTQDILDGSINFNDFRGIAFVGGFSFADVFGAGRAWFLSFYNRHDIMKKLMEFHDRPDTFSLGICNGCQLMAHLEWIPGTFTNNTSGRFESRWSTVKILPNNSIMLQNMQNSVLGVWVAHGEGKYVINPTKLKPTQKCIAFVDDENNITTNYPMNPNGSIDGLTGICSENGRHLAMMPHPERSIMTWQTPYISRDLKKQLNQLDKGYNNYYPWIEMFKNAYRWCETN